MLLAPSLLLGFLAPALALGNGANDTAAAIKACNGLARAFPGKLYLPDTVDFTTQATGEHGDAEYLRGVARL